MEKKKQLGVPRVLEWEGEKPLPPIVDANLATFLLEQMASHGDETAMVDAVTREQRTYSYYCRQVPRVAGGLAAAGVAEGDVVLLMTPTHVDFPLVLLAVLHLGAVLLPASPLLTPKELAWLVDVSGARWAVVNGPGAEDKMAALHDLLPEGTLRKVWRMTHSLQSPSLTHLLQAKPIPPRQMGAEARTTVAMIFMSSGTTGRPKGVMLSHTNLIAPYICNRYLMSLIEGGNLVMKMVYQAAMIILPLHHMYGYAIMMNTIYFGGTAILLPNFSPKKFFETIEEFKITLCPLVPHIANFLSETPLLHQYDISSIIGFNSSAAPISPVTLSTVKEKTGKGFGTTYGMTEAVVICSNNERLGFKPGAVGRVFPHSQVKVVDTESGQMLAEGQEGEVCVRGPSRMLGYINDPKATAAAIDVDGWLHTGDLGYYDQDNFLFLTDRSRDIIKVKGLQVSPRELEELLRQVEGVSEVAVVGVPNPRMGEAPRAYVVPKPSAHLSPSYMQQFIAERVAAHKQLAGGVQLVDSLPRSQSGKVLKRKLRDDFCATHSKL